MERLKSWITWLRRVPPERYLILSLALITAALWIWVARMMPRPVEVIVFDVGKGDAMLVRGPTGRAVLIDGGSSTMPNVGEKVLAPNLLLLGVRQLDAVIITHPDDDHVNGLPAVLEAVPVGMLIDSGATNECTAFQQVLETALRKGIPRYTVRAGDRVNLSSTARLWVLAPSDPLLTGTGSDENNHSVVCLLEHRNARMLFTGDLEAAGEAALLSRYPSLPAEVLKVSHHGSRDATGEDFLRAVRPTRAIISCPAGAGSGHPHSELLDRLRTHGVRVIRTDVHGQVRLSTHGDEWTVRTPYARRTTGR